MAANGVVPDFNPRYFYTLNNLGLSNFLLSSSPFRGTNGVTNMTVVGFTSGENWQLFYQQGRYFIRNYDYGSTYQLGVTADSRDVPMLYPRSGGLGQQWSIRQVDGGWELSNGLWGNGTELALLQDYQAPAMQAGSSQTVWNITRNPSAEVTGPKGTEMYTQVKDFEVSQISSSSTIPSATSSGTSLPSSTSAASSSPTSTLSSLNTPAPASPSALSGGAIAGISIGVTAIFAASLIGLWFFMKRRKATKNNPYLDYHGRPAEKYAYHAELEVPPSEMPAPVGEAPRQDKGAVDRAVELPGAPVR